MARGAPVVGRPVRLARAGPAARPRRAPRRRPSSAGGRTAPRIVLASDQAPRLAELLGEAGHPVAVVERVAEAPPPGAIALVERSLNGGFDGGPDGLAFVTDRELFGTVRVRRPQGAAAGRPARHPRAPDARRPRRPHRPRRRALRADAPARRRRARSATTSSCRSPAATGSSSRSSRSAGSRATRAASARRSRKLGGTEWLRAKQRVRKAVDDLAEELLALYAARAGAQGHASRPDTPWQARDGGVVPVRGDADQLRAAAEVKADMERGRPMDRLVVGDVGYGKTEVALRAAFKAIQDGKQVAVLVPTTVLAAQHLRDVLRSGSRPSRSRSGCCRGSCPRSEQAATLDGLADGTVDIVIGTHRLLSKDVRFKDLGLVVVDEEQRFGVAAKERLKQLRREVDVLTLSATPIPRTLNLALAGIRDLSASSRRRPRTGCRSRPASPRRRPGSSATRSCASSTAAARSSTSTTGSRRSRRRPSSCAGCCRARGSSSGTARWPRARSRR